METTKFKHPDFDIIEDMFVVGYGTQRQWSLLIASAFFLGELGAVIFVVSGFYNYYLGAFIGFLVATLGKGIAHLMYLGRPERFLRAFCRPKSSWISRGLISIVVFNVFGGLYLLPFLSQWIGIKYAIVSEGSSIWLLSKGISLFASFVLITYDGFLMSVNQSIPLWNTSILPILCLTYALLGGSTFVSFLHQYNMGNPSVLNIIYVHNIETFFVVFNMILIFTYVYTMYCSTIAAKKSAMLLIKGRYMFQFMGLTITVGLILILGLLYYFNKSDLRYIIPAIVIAELIGDFTIKYVLLRAGVFYPEIY